MAWSLPWARKAAHRLPAADLDAPKMPGRGVTTLAAHGIPSPAAQWGRPGAVRPPRPTTRRSMACRRRSPTCCPGSSTCPIPRACCWKTASRSRLLRAGAGRHRGPRDGLAVAGARCAGERPAGLVRRTRRQPLGGAALRPGRTDWDNYLRSLADYLRPRAPGSAFSDFYLRFFAHHLRAIAKPGGLFEDTTVTRLPWRGQVRRVRMVVYRRASAATAARRGQSPEQALTTICDRLVGGLANAGVKTRRSAAADIHAWLLRWFNPHPTLLGPTTDDRERFYADPLIPESGRRRDRTRQRHRLRAAPVLRPARSDVVNGTVVVRRHAASGHRDGPPAHATRDGPSDRRDAQRRRCHQRAVRPDARRHGDVPDAGRHAAGRAEAHLNHLAGRRSARRWPRSRPARTCSRRAA